MNRLIASLVLALALLLAGCSSADTATDEPALASAGSDAAGGDDGGGGEDAAGGGAAEEEESGTGSLADGQVAQDGPLMVRTAELELRVDDVTEAVDRVRATAAAADGWVSSEEVAPGTEGQPGQASVVMRVPSGGLDGLITSLGEVGEVTRSRSSAEDVTTEYRDVEARVATLEAGAGRLRELVGQAGSVEDIAALERELSSREADLDALKARMKVLGEDVSRSTVTVHLAEEGAESLAQEPRTGFVAGLQQGWAAFTTSLAVLVTALGALLPFLVVAALAAASVLWWRRRRRIASSGDRRPDAAGDPDRS